MRTLALIAAIVSLLSPVAARAAATQVAVAANFAQPAQEIAALFKARTGHTAVLTFGSSGQFYAQIANGAPFQVFLSADAERPQKAEAERFAVAGTRFTYATGRLVLYSATPGLVDGRGAVLAHGRFDKLALADPAAAPYGQAAVETLRKMGLYDRLAPKLVQGSSITQAYQFVETGAAELGFVALSQVAGRSGGSRWVVPESFHAPIRQQAVLLRTGAGNPAAQAFLDFLKGAEARAVIRRFGYQVP